MRDDNIPIGYVTVGEADSFDLGYGLKKEFWRRGIMTEAAKAVLDELKKDGIPYVTATHDVKNPKSGEVMKRLGMKYRYSYEEQWQPKNIKVVFRMYQLDLDGNDGRVFTKYREISPSSFVEKNCKFFPKG